MTNAVTQCGKPLYWIDVQVYIRNVCRLRGIVYKNDVWKQAVAEQNIPHLIWIKNKNQQKRQLLALKNEPDNQGKVQKTMSNYIST